MTIQPSGPSGPRLDGTVPTRVAPGVVRITDETQLNQSESPATGQRDVLDLSPAARALVARADEKEPLPAERLLQIRQRILDGAYDAPLVLDAVAAALRKRSDPG